MKRQITLLLAIMLIASPCIAESHICTEEVSSLSIQVAQLQAQISTLSTALDSLTNIEVEGQPTNVSVLEEAQGANASAQAAHIRIDKLKKLIKRKLNK